MTSSGKGWKNGIPLGVLKLALQAANSTLSTNSDGGQETVPQTKKKINSGCCNKTLILAANKIGFLQHLCAVS